MTSRNVFLITVDSVRADYCGFLGSEWDTTPTLSELADESVIFENAIAPGPQTLSSVPAIHTGEPFPITDHNVTDYQERISRIQKHLASHETIAEEFKNAGYSTACIEANPWTSQTSGFDKGYDVFLDVGGEQRKHVSERFEGTAFGPPLRILSQWYHNDGWFSQWPNFYDKITSVVSDLPEPYFVWIFLLDTHNPYIVGKEDRVESSAPGMYYATLRANSVQGGNTGTNYSDELSVHVEKQLKQAYRDSIRSVDRFVAKLLSEFSEQDPVLALYSDHGEGFGDHGNYGHQHALFEENIHVPFLIYNSGTSGRLTEPFSLLQLPDILQEAALADECYPSKWTSEYAFSRTEDSSLISIRGSRWKFIFSEKEKMLFDIKRDSKELQSLIGEKDSIIDELQSIVESRLKSLPREEINITTEENSEVFDRLDSLGYVG